LKIKNITGREENVWDFFSLLVPGIEISIIAVMIYYFLSFFWNTRAMDVIFGLLAFLALFAISNWLQLSVIQKLMYYFVNVAVIAILVLFQPEIRLALSKLSVKGKKYHEVTEFDRFLDGISTTIYRLAEKRFGALVVLENQDSLDEYANKSVLLHATFSSELLESIFVIELNCTFNSDRVFEITLNLSPPSKPPSGLSSIKGKSECNATSSLNPL
jgi:DNA integrity scanning protein DisA with diadenylate cyclase activity